MVVVIFVYDGSLVSILPLALLSLGRGEFFVLKHVYSFAHFVGQFLPVVSLDHAMVAVGHHSVAKGLAQPDALQAEVMVEAEVLYE